MKCKTCGYEPSRICPMCLTLDGFSTESHQHKRMTRKEIINALTDPKLPDDYEGFYLFHKLNKHTLVAMDMGPNHDGIRGLARIDIRLIEDKKPTTPEEVIDLFIDLVNDPKCQIPEVNHETNN